MARGRSSPSFDRAAFANEHVFYEVQMFVSARDRLSYTAERSFERNAMIELAAIHFRNLFDFFYLSNPRADDVVAADYIDQWEAHRPAATANLDYSRTRANREMAHLTLGRIAGEPSNKRWDFEALSSELRPAVRKFLGVVDARKISPRVRTELMRI